MSENRVNSIVDTCGVYRVQLANEPTTQFHFLPPAAAQAIISQGHHDANIEMTASEDGVITYTFPEENEYAVIIVNVALPCVATHTKEEFQGSKVSVAWARDRANKALKRIAWCAGQGNPKYISEILNHSTIYFNTLIGAHKNGVVGSLMS